jgi:hypothetical protein
MATLPKPEFGEEYGPQEVKNEVSGPQEVTDTGAGEHEMSPEQLRATHTYNAHAYVLKAELEEPARESISARAKVHLPKDGHYQFEHADPFRFKGIISYRSGYTQVAGHAKTKRGFVTLATAVVEGVNVLDVVTADRVVGQISTQHPLFPDGSIPAVSFLGTRFDNLRIGGHPVKVDRCLEILGPWRKPEKSFFEDDVVKARLADQYTTLQQQFDDGVKGHPEEKDLRQWLKGNYPKEAPLVRDVTAPGQQPTKQMGGSLVQGVEDSPYLTFGHVIHVPHFGKIILGELKVSLTKAEIAKDPDDQEHDKYTFSLTMIRLEMGCLGKGSANIVALDTNGGGSGGHH